MSAVESPINLDLGVADATQLFGEDALTRRFDRYWRNARVLASHNPAIIREAAIGDFYLNGHAHNERFGVARPTEIAAAA